MDFKGQFLTRNGRYCYPFTVSDMRSRYVLCCDGYLSVTAEGARERLERIFREHGLPEAIPNDNGAPFASTGVGRLTKLGVWLVSLGITRQLIEPGRPAQNGKYERMHRTLKKATTRPFAMNLARQQVLFDRFRKEFHEERPHEALEMRRPADIYRPSPRPFPEKLPAIEYLSRPPRGSPRQPKRWRDVERRACERRILSDRAVRRLPRGRRRHLGPLLRKPQDRAFRQARPDARRHPWYALPLWKARRSRRGLSTHIRQEPTEEEPHVRLRSVRKHPRSP
jgi:hypothetical protein